MKHLILVQRKLLQFLLITYTHVKFLHLIPYLFHHETARQPLPHTTNLLGYRCESLLQLFQVLQLHALLQLQLLLPLQNHGFLASYNLFFLIFTETFPICCNISCVPNRIARTSGAFCNWSQISNAAAFALQFDKDSLNLLT